MSLLNCKRCGKQITGFGKTGFCKSCTNRKRKGYHLSETAKENMRKPKSEEHKKKLSEARKGKTYKEIGRKPHSKETREKMSKVKKGIQFSEITKKRMSFVRKGRKLTKEWKEKIAKKSVFQKGEKHINWQGGISREPYSFEFNKELKEKIKKRDNYTCQLCNRKEENESKTDIFKRGLSIHHIDYNKQNNNPDNLISLCRKCNSFVNFNREDWTKYFKNKLKK